MRYRERKARDGKKKKNFMFKKAAGSNLKTEESSRMAVKKYRQYGNFVGRMPGQRRFLMSVECFRLCVLSSEKEFKKNELIMI